MKNIISKTVTGVGLQSQKAIAGVTGHAITLSLALVAVLGMTSRRNDFITARDLHVAGKGVLREKRGALKATMLAAMVFLEIARDVLKPYLGKTPAAFAVVGYGNSLAVPRSQAGVLRVLEGCKAYLTANPAHENVGLNVTVERATSLITDLTNGIAAVDQQTTIVGDLIADRNAKMKLVGKDLSLLLSELHAKLDPISAMWESFGFNRPGILAMPDVPANVIAVLIGPNAIALKWNKAARASHYRVWKKVVGVDLELIPVGSPADLDFTLEGLPAGATVELAVSAVNNGGESQKTEAVSITTTV